LSQSEPLLSREYRILSAARLLEIELPIPLLVLTDMYIINLYIYYPLFRLNSALTTLS